MLDYWYKFGNFGVEKARSHQVVETQKTERALGGRGDKFRIRGMGFRVSSVGFRVQRFGV